MFDPTLRRHSLSRKLLVSETDYSVQIRILEYYQGGCYSNDMVVDFTGISSSHVTGEDLISVTQIKQEENIALSNQLQSQLHKAVMDKKKAEQHAAQVQAKANDDAQHTVLIQNCLEEKVKAAQEELVVQRGNQEDNRMKMLRHLNETQTQLRNALTDIESLKGHAKNLDKELYTVTENFRGEQFELTRQLKNTEGYATGIEKELKEEKEKLFKANEDLAEVLQNQLHLEEKTEAAEKPAVMIEQRAATIQKESNQKVKEAWQLVAKVEQHSANISKELEDALRQKIQVKSNLDDAVDRALSAEKLAAYI